MLRRTLMLLGLSIFSVFLTHVIGFAGAGGLCTLVLAFLAALGWDAEKVINVTSALILIPACLFNICCLSVGPRGSHGGPLLGCVPATSLWPDWSRDQHSKPQPWHRR